MQITRSYGTVVPFTGYIAGGGYKGATDALDDAVKSAAEWLATEIGEAIQIRFNSNRLSGGAFIDVPYAAGITARIWSLSKVHDTFERYGDDPSFETACASRFIDPCGNEDQISFAVFLDAVALNDPALADQGIEERRYAYIGAATLEDAAAIFKRHYVKPSN